MAILAFILNLPWTLLGVIGAILSVPRSMRFSGKPLAVIFSVRSFWWWRWLPGQKMVRTMVNGHCVQIGPRADGADLEHELIHVEQAIRQPFIHPFLYLFESKKKGYRQNKFEEEAYARSGNRYEED